MQTNRKLNIKINIVSQGLENIQVDQFPPIKFFGHSKTLYKILEVHFTNFSGKSETSKSYKILFV